MRLASRDLICTLLWGILDLTLDLLLAYAFIVQLINLGDEGKSCYFFQKLKSGAYQVGHHCATLFVNKLYLVIDLF